MNALLIASSLALAPIQPHDHHGSRPALGDVSFESSCAPSAHRKLIEALGWLHSFEYEQAEDAFQGAAGADPRCIIARWGVAMSNFHPLWAPPTAAELEKGRAALAKAGMSKAGSPRERAYVEALNQFYRDSDRLDHKRRLLAYTGAMQALHERYPNDPEAAVFFALALVASGTIDDDPAHQRESQAAAILNAVLVRQPNHPGVTHYLIHDFDYPGLAQGALPAARRYAGLAPASAHAQHMPSHIFTRLGLWDESITSNRRAEAAARGYAASRKLPGAWDEQLHAMDYLMYAYLQMGMDREAKALLGALNAIARVDPPNFKVAYSATAIPARFLLERRRWSEAATLALSPNLQRMLPWARFPWAMAHVHFARAIGAARNGQVGLARSETDKLRAIEQSIVVPPGEYDWRRQVEIQRQVAAGWLALAEGRKSEAVQFMTAAADLDDSTEKHPVTPGSILPAREQLGELLLELGKPAEALREFDASLVRAPRRLAGVYGAARAARRAGDTGRAKSRFAELLELGSGGDGTRPEFREARSFARTPARH